MYKPDGKTSAVNSGTTQQGLSLVELLIAMSLGIFLVWGAIQAFLSGKQAYSLQENLSRIQENVRMAQEFMGSDIRSAGDYGCGGGDTFLRTTDVDAADLTDCAKPYRINMINNVGTDPRYNFDRAVESITKANAAALAYLAPVPDSDVLVLHPAKDIGALTAPPLGVAETPEPINALKIAPVSNVTQNFTATLKANDVVAVSDCGHLRIWELGAVGAAGADSSLAGGTKGNCGSNYAELQDGATVKQVDTVMYYIGVSPTGVRTLYRYSMVDGAVEPLLDGVEKMDVQFGVDTNADSTIDSYKTGTGVTAAEWSGWDVGNGDTSAVRAVRYSLLFSGTDSVLSSSQTYSFPPGSSVTATDNKLHMVFTSTVGIRNRTNPGAKQ